MSEKRFIETISTGIITDTETGKEYKCEMRIDEDFLDLVNELADENEQLKKELFEARKDYILETYADNPIRRDEKLKALEKELGE